MIFMDCMMPIMDGFDATREIRLTLPEYQSTYIIGLTALAQREDRERGIQAGMNEFLSKPPK